MKRLISISVLFFVCLASAAIAEDFWVSFATGGAAYLMKVSDTGKVVMAPAKIVSGPIFLTTLSRLQPGKLTLLGADFSYGSNPYSVKRVFINESSLAVSALKSTGIKLSGNSISATQTGMVPFLSGETGEVQRAYGLTSDGVWTGTRWGINPRISRTDIIESGVSPDGRMAWGSLNWTSTKLYVQPLNVSGLPSATPTVALNGSFAPQGDLSAILSSGRMFLVSNDIDKNEVRLQQINGTTGQTIGGPRILAETSSGSFQSVAVEPKGRFVIYLGRNTECPWELFYFQALDSAGNASGTPKELFSCEAQVLGQGLDVMD